MRPTLKRCSLPVLAVTVAVAGCTSMGSRHPVPANLVDRAQVPGLPEARTVLDPVDVNVTNVDRMLGNAIERARQRGKPLTLLALSGGGPQGAYGAGLLCGWTQAGGRPEFDVVVGISTGSLIGPFAFLGPAYDEQLKKGYTTVTDKQVYDKRSVFAILFGSDSVASSAPLAKLIAQEMNQGVIDAVAAEYRKGRRFYVGTTDLDAQCLMVWDMGAIAASRRPDAARLFRQVLLASASIPVAFPPVRIEVEADGQRYDELHADGGVMTQVFGTFFLDRLMVVSGQDEGRLFLVRNEVIHPEWKAVKPRIFSVAGRSIGTLIKTQGLGDIYRNFLVAKTAGMDFNYASIPFSFNMKHEGEFDPVYMKALFDIGFEEGRTGSAWKKTPPAYRLVGH
jgi:hypothetical protein